MPVRVTEKSETKGLKTLYANTRNVRMERKLQRDVSSSSKLTAKLVPVPMPVGMQPNRNTETK